MISVLAVVSALTAILSPRVFLYVEDAKQIQARGGVRQIAAAIQTKDKDTRRWALLQRRPGHIDLLEWDRRGNPDQQWFVSRRSATCDPSGPEDATSDDTWGIASAIGQSLTNQLVRDRPFVDHRPSRTSSPA